MSERKTVFLVIISPHPLRVVPFTSYLSFATCLGASALLQWLIFCQLGFIYTWWLLLVLYFSFSFLLDRCSCFLGSCVLFIFFSSGFSRLSFIVGVHFHDAAGFHILRDVTKDDMVLMKLFNYAIPPCVSKPGNGNGKSGANNCLSVGWSWRTGLGWGINQLVSTGLGG